MKAKFCLLPLFLVLLVTGTACGLFGGGDGAQPPPAGPFQITVDNQSAYDICYVLISASDDDSWGDDHLGDEDTIKPGQQRPFERPAGIYDVMLLTCDDTVLHTAWGIAQATTLTVGGGGRLALTVQNDSETDLCYLYVEPSSREVWGDDELGDEEILQPGGKRIFFFPPETYDLRADDCDQQLLAESYNVALTADLIWVLSQTPGEGGDGQRFNLRVENRSPREICHAFIAPTSARTWGRDRLEDGERIGHNDFREFDLSPGTYDALLLDCEQAVLETGWNLSTGSVLSVGGEGLVEVEVVNESSVEICNVLMTPSTDDRWGEDRLGAEEVIPAKEGVRYVYVEPDTYDLLAQDCQGEDVVQRFEADLTLPQTWTIVDK